MPYIVGGIRTINILPHTYRIVRWNVDGINAPCPLPFCNFHTIMSSSLIHSLSYHHLSLYYSHMLSSFLVSSITRIYEIVKQCENIVAMSSQHTFFWSKVAELYHQWRPIRAFLLNFLFSDIYQGATVHFYFIIR